MKAPRPTMRFDNPVFDESQEYQYTVRVETEQGTKWRDVLELDSVVNIGDSKGEFIRQAVVHDAYSIEFELISLFVLAYEHDPKCHSPEGLFAALQKAYPDELADLGVTSIEKMWDIEVTVIGLILK